jgi:hypothetical protein
MVDNGTSETATEMTPSTSEVCDDKPSTSSEEVVTMTNTESSKKKKKKKRDSASLAKIDTTEGKNEEEKENGTINDKEKDATTTTTTTTTMEKDNNDKEKKSTDGVGKEKEKKKVQSSGDPSSGPVISTTKRTRPPYKFNVEKITLRFLFANKDGFTITIECKPDTTVGEVKGQLLSVWPEGKLRVERK